jgi:hypothetical protein
MALGRPTVLDALHRDDFSRHLHSRFRIYDGSTAPLEVELVEATDGPSYAAQHETFSLLFQGPRATPLGQSVYRIEHDVLGTFDLLLVPVGESPSGRHYEAIINRWPGFAHPGG